MSVLFKLSQDFIDKLSNPSYGSVINEEYSLKLGLLMEDERFKDILVSEAARIKDPEELTLYGWIWLLRWCRANQVKLNNSLLSSLIERSPNVFFKTLVIDLATYDSDTKLNNTQYGDDLPDEWSRNVILGLTKTQASNNDSSQREQTYNLQSLENFLISLLQLGTDPAIVAARFLLNFDWAGQQSLLNSFWARFDILDEGTQRAWLQLIRPPDRDSIKK